MISRDDFRTVDIRVGRVVAVEDLPEARRPSYKLTVDLGPLGTRRSVAALRSFYGRARSSAS